jgi:succinate dehydrogenase/fumarate reductase cytochrome b subunit
MENTSRHIFHIHGITGMLIATVLLLSILAALTFLGVLTQQSVADKPYKFVEPQSIQMNSYDNKNHRQQVGE